jgi:poly(3-hydroxybutyrate) depolymerase
MWHTPHNKHCGVVITGKIFKMEVKGKAAQNRELLQGKGEPVMSGRFKYRLFITLACLLFIVIVAGSGSVTGLQNGSGNSADMKTDENTPLKEGKVMRERYRTPGGETGFIYFPSSYNKSGNNTYPLVIMMNGTAQNPIHDAEGTGWTTLAPRENILLVVPEYDDYATYSNVNRLISVLDYIEDTYPVDRTRVYSTGFSNGGAMSVALASEHPERLAAISAYGWMVDMRHDQSLADRYDIPFQVLQGTQEYTEKDTAGNPMIMQDEREAIRSLFLFNEMISAEKQPDYRQVPYWGYEPSSVETKSIDGVKITISSYQKEGYHNPLTQLVLIDGETHRVHPYDAELAWNFMKKFRRDERGRLFEK